MTDLRLPAALFALWALAACTSERVVLLPPKDGHASAVVIRSAQGETRLSSPYAMQDRVTGGGINRYQASTEHVQARFAQALDVRPTPPQSFVVYFDSGGDQLATEATAEFEKIKAEVARRRAPEILVIGHTDRVGSLEHNDALSLKRAEAVRRTLIDNGFPESMIGTAGRGEREPLVPTGDEIPEAQNRRAEILVR